MKMNLSIRQLQTFVEVMRSGSISDAARSLGRTQPAVSSTIAGLEEEIGFALFERERKRIVPKPEAYYFLEEAEVVLKRLTQAERTILQVGSNKKGDLRIACSPAASTYFMPHTLSEFLADKPDVSVTLMMRSSTVVTDWIASQQYDIGFGESSEDRQTIQAKRFTFPCLCAMPATSSLIGKSVITPRDLIGKPLAAIQEDHILSVRTRKAFAAQDISFTQRFEFESIIPALKLASEGLCYLICDSFSAFNHQNNYKENSGIVFRPFEPIITLQNSLMAPANRPLSKLAEELLDLLSRRLDQYTKFQG